VAQRLAGEFPAPDRVHRRTQRKAADDLGAAGNRGEDEYEGETE